MIYDSLLPDVTFYMRERDPSLNDSNPFVWAHKTTKDLFAGKKVLIFGLPGAFTPTCSNSQLPGYEALYDEFIKLGVEEIWCTSVNDAFVMFQWGCTQLIENVQMLPDGNGEFAEQLGMLVDKSNLGFGKRSWRYAMLVDDLVIKDIWTEEFYMDNCPIDPYEKSAPEYVLAQTRDYLT